MKKKIKDLTWQELEDICNNFPCCLNCPLNKGEIFKCYGDEKTIAEDPEEIKESEVEVDE